MDFKNCLQEFGGWLLEKIAQGIGLLMLGVVWGAVGAFISLPFFFLSSGTSRHFPVFILFGPAVALVLFFAFCYSTRAQARGWRIRPTRWPHWSFWTLVVWTILPIITNGLSRLCEVIGWQKTGEILFTLRYKSLFLPVLLLFVFVIVGTVWQGIKELLPKSTAPT